MTEPIYKQFQRLYEELVTEHEDDFKHMEIVESDELVEHALDYFREARFPLVYPAKSYAVAIIYATLIEQWYNIPLRKTLDDPDLFLGHDQYFVTYSEDPLTYEDILVRLADMPLWIQGGWAPKTAEYCRLECTEAGLDSLNG